VEKLVRWSEQVVPVLVWCRNNNVRECNKGIPFNLGILKKDVETYFRRA